MNNEKSFILSDHKDLKDADNKLIDNVCGIKVKSKIKYIGC